MSGVEFVQGSLFRVFFMSMVVKYTRILSFWVVLLLLAGTQAWAQTTSGPAFIISGKGCVSDLECKTESLTFTDTTRRVTNRKWDFGDNTPVTLKDSVVQHGYMKPGSYTVKLTQTRNGKDTVLTRSVTVYANPAPFPQWRTDTTICKGDVITLDPYSGKSQPNYNYLWYPKGDTTQTIKVDSSGCYSVEATDPATGCSYQNRINVDVCGEQKQSQGVKWYFGANAGLDFSGGGAPKPITDGKLNTIEGSSSIANTKGVLLFYTDGITIYAKDGKPMKSLVPGDTNAVQIPLDGNQHSTQSALIVPKPTCRGCEYLYYVYTTSEIRGQKTLTYSVVDMRQNGGKGAIVQKNIPISRASTEQSAAVENKRDSTYWVISRIYGTNKFEIRHVTTGETPVVTTYNGGQVIDSLTNAEGYIKIGPADTTGGNKGNRPMAVVIPGPPKNSIDLYTFNDSTGKMTFVRTVNIGPAPPKAYGVEFSPDGKSLYVTMLADTNSDGSQKGASYILKYDISQKDSSLLAGSRMVVDSSTTRQYGAIQIGPDGRIYVAIKGSSSLGTINNPNGGLLDSLVYNPTGQSLGGQTSQLGLPNLVANFNDQSSGPGLTYSDTCARQPTTFQVSPRCQKLKEQYTLTFGDGSAPKSFTSTQPQTHTYQQAGTYPVSLFIQTFKSDGKTTCGDTLIRDTLTILETPPDIKLGADTAICNKKGITLDLKVQAKVYVWVVNGGVVSRQKQLTLTLPGFYHVIGLAANGECFKSDTIDVQIKPTPSLDLGPDTVFCYRTSVSLTVPQQTWTQFQWSNGGNTRTISVSKAGTYTVTAQSTVNGTTCENSDTIRVSELPKLRLAATLTGPKACTSADGSIVLKPTPAGNYRYDWTRTDGTVLADTVSQQTGLTEGGYKISVTEVTHACKLDTAFTLKSTANQLALAPRVKDALCSTPNSGTISLTLSGGTAVSYSWLNLGNTVVATTPVFDKAAPGLYNVQVTDANGCKAIKDSIKVGLDSTGFARLGPNELKCAGESVSLTPSDSQLPGNVYQWSNGATTPTITVSQPGSYSIVVRNTQTGCVGRSSVQVNDRPAPVFALTKEAVLCEGDQGRAQLVASGATGLHYLWLTLNDTTKTITVSKVGQYAVLVTDPQGCTATATALVVNKCEPRVNVPDAFTPNNDGVNDVLQVFSAYVTDFELRVYNRWGEVIFVSNNPEQKWDGTYKGAAYPSMLYPWVITYKSESFPERNKIVKRGSVLLLR